VHHKAVERKEWDPEWQSFDEFTLHGKIAKLGRDEAGEIQWARMDFNWPLWILFSSGTTGLSHEEA